MVDDDFNYLTRLFPILKFYLGAVHAEQADQRHVPLVQRQVFTSHFEIVDREYLAPAGNPEIVKRRDVGLAGNQTAPRIINDRPIEAGLFLPNIKDGGCS